MLFCKSELRSLQDPAAQTSVIGNLKGWFGLSSIPVTGEKTTEEIW